MELILQSFHLTFKCLNPLIFLRVHFRLRCGISLSHLIIFKSLVAFGKLIILLGQFHILLLEELQLILDIFQIGQTLLIDPAFFQIFIQEFDLFIGFCIISLNLSKQILGIQQFSTYLLLLQSDRSKFFVHIFDFLFMCVTQSSPFLSLSYLLMQFLLKRYQISFRSCSILAALGEILELSASLSTMVQFIFRRVVPRTAAKWHSSRWKRICSIILIILCEMTRTSSVHFLMSFRFGLFERTDIDFPHFLG